MNLRELTEATPEADWSSPTPDGIVRGTTYSGATIQIVADAWGAEYCISCDEPGLNDSGELTDVEQLRRLIEDVADEGEAAR